MGSSTPSLIEHTPPLLVFSSPLLFPFTSNAVLGTVISCSYISILSFAIFIPGTVCVFLFEMEDGKVSSRDRTMTFTTFVMFDMFNALACRHNNRPVFELSWNSNKAFLLAMAFSLLGQTAVLYFPPLQKVFRTVSLSFTDLIFVVILTSSMLVLDTVRKEYFPSIFTEVLSSDSFRNDKGKVKTDDKSFMV